MSCTTVGHKYFIEKKGCMGNIACHVYAVLDIRQKKELIRVLNGI